MNRSQHEYRPIFYFLSEMGYNNATVLEHHDERSKTREDRTVDSLFCCQVLKLGVKTSGREVACCISKDHDMFVRKGRIFTTAPGITVLLPTELYLEEIKVSSKAGSSEK